MSNLKYRQWIGGEFWYWGYGVNKDPNEFVPPKDPTEPSEQWTGLSDNNGIKVYANDLVAMGSTLYKIIWSESMAGFKKRPLNSFGSKDPDELMNKSDTLLLKGNIHENSDMLRRVHN